MRLPFFLQQVQGQLLVDADADSDAGGGAQVRTYDSPMSAYDSPMTLLYIIIMLFILPTPQLTAKNLQLLLALSINIY